MILCFELSMPYAQAGTVNGPERIRDTTFSKRPRLLLW